MISYWENSKHPPGIDLADAICRTLNLDSQEIQRLLKQEKDKRQMSRLRRRHPGIFEQPVHTVGSAQIIRENRESYDEGVDAIDEVDLNELMDKLKELDQKIELLFKQTECE
jgi:DNA-binding MurR/RpiR family transcriptional regulator